MTRAPATKCMLATKRMLNVKHAFAFCIAAAVLTTAVAQQQSSTQPASQAATPTASSAQARQMTELGTRFLLSAQDQDGGWATQTGPGISCLVLKALVREPNVGPSHPAVQRGVAWVLRSQRPDGGIYSAEGLYKNYESAVALSMLAALNLPEHRERIQALQKYLKDLQWDESEDKSASDPWYGGCGYGNHKRPDINNTHMMLDALRDSGLKSDDPAYQKALAFVQRCQMVSETNDQPLAAGSTEGGFIYTPANNGESKAGYVEIAGRRQLRCFGSVTYGGFKSLLYAGLNHDDPRVQAALGWIQSHWTLEHNPNMPERQTQEGLFFYYHVFSRALRAWGEDVITSSDGAPHNWRDELTAQLARLQRPDGSWVNEADRYFEGVPALTTAYSVLALQEAYPVTGASSPRRSR